MHKAFELRSLAVGALLTTLVACAGQPDPSEVLDEPMRSQEAKALSTRVVGYFPTWQGDVNAIQYDKLTHINYSFLLPTAQGGLTGLSSGDARLRSLVQAAHAKGVKVQVAVGGWMDGNDAPFEQMAANASARTTFVNNVLAFVEQAGLDGVDIDWEWPEPGASAQNFGALMNQLGTALHARGKILTAAVLATGGDGIPTSSFADVDFLNIMAYDMGYPHSSYDIAVQSMNYWLGRGLPASKAVLGVPFYGKDSGNGAYTYAQLVAMDPQAPNKDVVNGIYYNGIPTIKAKAQLALQRGGGIMIWEISQDTSGTTSLLNAISQVVGGGTTNPAPSVNLTSPANGTTFTPGSTITVSANASDSNGRVTQVVFYAGAQKLGTVTSAPYSLAWLNVAAGSYTLTAVATDDGGATTTSAAVSITVTSGTGGSCAGVAAWDATKVYVKGDQVTSGGKLWRAQWWTQNEVPTQSDWGVWVLVSNC
ncbi:Chitinase [Cystobacter fuscus DSM 2262]|uniref:chitinase n=1 Tax=Cystobacter fuscus (strain ATCC 25194 / DSM 2262 / NBRC 100088 / M29) TaxID=1242864 RepID=S9R882_CYSF2|nr:glycosyl hydrolase family 18 protein [Cystobacter fuscus]EPX65303.1 Chitinase [Cystobacter fuscus DSM 2262]